MKVKSAFIRVAFLGSKIEFSLEIRLNCATSLCIKSFCHVYEVGNCWTSYNVYHIVEMIVKLHNKPICFR